MMVCDKLLKKKNKTPKKVVYLNVIFANKEKC